MILAAWRLVLMACVILLTVPFAGCVFSNGGGGSSRGVKLSEAMESSASGDERDLGGARPRQEYRHQEYAQTESSSGGGGSGFAAVSYDENEYFWQSLISAAYSVPFNGQIKSMTHYTLMPIALEEERGFLGLYLGGAGVRYESGSLPDIATKDPWMFELGLTLRQHLNHPRTGFSPYLAASLGYELMLWNYRNPIIVGGERIEGDSLSGGSGSLGIGVATRRDSHFGAFAEAGVGGMLFACETSEGFDNDVFDNFGFFYARVGLSFKF